MEGHWLLYPAGEDQTFLFNISFLCNESDRAAGVQKTRLSGEALIPVKNSRVCRRQCDRYREPCSDHREPFQG